MNQLLKVSLGQLPTIIISDPSFKDSSWNQHVIDPLPKGDYELEAYAKPVSIGRDSYVQFDFLIRHLIPEMERMPLAKLTPNGDLKLNDKLVVIGDTRKIGLNEPRICICTVEQFRKDPFAYAVDTFCGGRVGEIQTILLKGKQTLFPLKEELRKNRTGLYAIHVQLQLERFQGDENKFIDIVSHALQKNVRR